MPHLTIDYSANLEDSSNIWALCQEAHNCLRLSGVFELGAIRVRARPCPHFAVADLLPQNAFADLVLRIGAGRSEDEKKRIGADLMRVAETHFAPQLAAPHFALSLEVQEISAALSWKTNAIHPRLRTA
jgi:5-carboxymethyl-2-hydroxymuconate isomerase